MTQFKVHLRGGLDRDWEMVELRDERGIKGSFIYSTSI